jgi:CMP-N-acetylneuraminic acid synthetase
MRNLPCFILSRKNSKGLRNKNIYKFLGKPLIQHTIDYAKKVKSITDIIISTDDPKVVEIAKKNKCIVIYPRPKKLSNDTASSFSALYHAANYMLKNNYDFEIFSYLQITEPLRPKNILAKCINNLKIDDKINSSFAGFEMKKNFWFQYNRDFKMISYVGGSKLPRQKRKAIFRQDCGIALASRKKVLINMKKLYVNPIKIVPYSGYEGLLDIHKKKDITLAKYLKKLI